MAKAIFGYAETPNDICTAGGICKKALPCADCKGLIGKLSQLFQDQVRESENDSCRIPIV